MCVPGKPSKDTSHPDYAPSIFQHRSHSESKSTTALARYKRRIKPKSSLPQKKLKFLSDDSGVNEQLPEDNATTPVTSDFGDGINPIQEEDEVAMLKTEINFLRSERDAALQKIEVLQSDLSSTRLSVSRVVNNDELCKFYTGITYTVFTFVFNFIAPFLLSRSTKESLSNEDQLFITLTRLRLNVPFKFLSDQCNCSEETIRRYFWRWVDLLHAKLNFLVCWPSRKAILETLPNEFRKEFPRLTSIVDCFEIFIDQSKNLNACAQTWSNYKHHNTIKVFIACTPTGAISYLSSAWGGRVSDIDLVRQSGFISSNFHLPGDQILADRGFMLEEDFAVTCSAELIIPSFTRGKKQMEARDVEKSRKIARVRVHIERVIGALKRRFRILQGVIPIRSIKSMKEESQESSLTSFDKILRVCAALVNLGPSVIIKDNNAKTVV